MSKTLCVVGVNSGNTDYTREWWRKLSKMVQHVSILKNLFGPGSACGVPGSFWEIHTTKITIFSNFGRHFGARGRPGETRRRPGSRKERSKGPKRVPETRREVYKNKFRDTLILNDPTMIWNDFHAFVRSRGEKGRLKKSAYRSLKKSNNKNRSHGNKWSNNIAQIEACPTKTQKRRLGGGRTQALRDSILCLSNSPSLELPSFGLTNKPSSR